MWGPRLRQARVMAPLEKSPEGRLLMEIMQKSCLDVVNDWFEDSRVKIHLLKFAAYGLTGPVVTGSEDNPQPDLDLPSISSQRIDLSCAADRGAIGIEDLVVVERRLEIRSIEYVEKLRPELHVEVF